MSSGTGERPMRRQRGKRHSRWGGACHIFMASQHFPLCWGTAGRDVTVGTRRQDMQGAGAMKIQLKEH